MYDSFSYAGVLPLPRARLKLFLFTPVFLDKCSNVDGALKFTQNDIINF